jgi:hypothetical protein
MRKMADNTISDFENGDAIMITDKTWVYFVMQIISKRQRLFLDHFLRVNPKRDNNLYVSINLITRINF